MQKIKLKSCLPFLLSSIIILLLYHLFMIAQLGFLSRNIEQNYSFPEFDGMFLIIGILYSMIYSFLLFFGYLIFLIIVSKSEHFTLIGPSIIFQSLASFFTIVIIEGTSLIIPDKIISLLRIIFSPFATIIISLSIFFIFRLFKNVSYNYLKK